MEGSRERTLKQAVILYEKYGDSFFTSPKAFREVGIGHQDIKYISLFSCLEKAHSTGNVQNKWKFIKDPRLIKN